MKVRVNVYFILCKIVTVTLQNYTIIKRKGSLLLDIFTNPLTSEVIRKVNSGYREIGQRVGKKKEEMNFELNFSKGKFVRSLFYGV